MQHEVGTRNNDCQSYHFTASKTKISNGLNCDNSDIGVGTKDVVSRSLGELGIAAKIDSFER